MGGKAFGSVDTVRLPTAGMAPIGHAVAEALGGRLVEWLRSKADHGDADVVVSSSVASAFGDESMAAAVGAATGLPHVSRRPDVRDPILFVGLQTPIGLFQVDLISAPDHLVDFATRYLSWGDLGTMIGRTAREAGLRFGQNGLRLPVTVPDAPRGSVTLTADFDEALDFLGYDPALHRAGFEDAAQAYGYVASGRWFDPKVYDAARGSSDSRRRAKKRPAVDGILSELQTRPGRFAWPDLKGPNPIQDEFVRSAVERFGKADEIEAVRQQLLSQALREESAFTLDAVTRISGLDGRDARAIGAIIKEDFPGGGSFPSWKRLCTPDDVRERVLAAMPILASRRAEEARRAEITAGHIRRAEANRAKRSVH